MGRTQGNKDFWLATLRSEGPVFRTTVGEADLGAPVPSCPGWTVADLAAHLASAYGWVAGHVSRGTTSRPDRAYELERIAAADVLAVYEERFTALVTLLDALDAEMPAWNWAPQAKRVAFWARRMAHETAVHRWDAQMALGCAEPLEAKLAADGVAEVLDTWLPAGRVHKVCDRTGLVALYATDLQQDWHIRLRQGGGVALLDTGTLFDDALPHERALAAGPASDIQLALWGRVGFDVLQMEGDEGLLACLRAG